MRRFIEAIKFERSNRGKLLWVITPDNVRVIGFWNKDYETDPKRRKLYQKWHNDHTSCGG